MVSFSRWLCDRLIREAQGLVFIFCFLVVYFMNTIVDEGGVDTYYNFIFILLVHFVKNVILYAFLFSFDNNTRLDIFLKTFTNGIKKLKCLN
jgi:hypothetical protein